MNKSDRTREIISVFARGDKSEIAKLSVKDVETALDELNGVESGVNSAMERWVAAQQGKTERKRVWFRFGVATLIAIIGLILVFYPPAS